jgi:hypothetical protein
LIEKYKFEERTRLEELKQGNSLSYLNTSSFSCCRCPSSLPSFSSSFKGHSSSSAYPPSSSSLSSSLVSFRDVVEEFALRNDVLFQQRLNPQTGETIRTMDRKSLWNLIM